MSARRDILKTQTGREINLHDPDPAAIHIVDIAHGLSNVCRFAGQTRSFYSVAAHSLNAVAFLEARGASTRQKLYALLHDASEAYIADMPSPVKNLSSGYRELEARLQGAIYERFGLSRKEPRCLKFVDDVMLAKERWLLFPWVSPGDWETFTGAGGSVRINYVGEETKYRFLEKFNELYGEYVLNDLCNTYNEAS